MCLLVAQQHVGSGSKPCTGRWISTVGPPGKFLLSTSCEGLFTCLSQFGISDPFYLVPVSSAGQVSPLTRAYGWGMTRDDTLKVMPHGLLVWDLRVHSVSGSSQTESLAHIDCSKNTLLHPSGQRRKILEDWKPTALMPRTFSCRPWSRLQESWCWLINCLLLIAGGHKVLIFSQMVLPCLYILEDYLIQRRWALCQSWASVLQAVPFLCRLLIHSEIMLF